MARRLFYPPAICERCCKQPPVGESLWHSGVVWLCPACLSEETPGQDLMTKIATKSVMAEETRALSRRERSAGDIKEAEYQKRQSSWHGHAAEALKSQSKHRVQNAVLISREAATSPGYFKDTLADPDLAAIESSEMRGRLLLSNDVVSLGIDISNTVGASNTLEKLLAHEIALAHKVAFEQAAMAHREYEPAMGLKRLQASAKMMATAQQGMLTLQKLRNGGAQQIVIQHVHVADGGQAVVGAVQAGGFQPEKK